MELLEDFGDFTNIHNMELLNSTMNQADPIELSRSSESPLKSPPPVIQVETSTTKNAASSVSENDSIIDISAELKKCCLGEMNKKKSGKKVVFKTGLKVNSFVSDS